MNEGAAGERGDSDDGGRIVFFRRTVLTGIAITYVTFLAGSWLHEAWGRRPARPARRQPGSDNVAPSASMVGVRLDVATKEIVVRADIVDPDQDNRGEGVTVSLQVHVEDTIYDNDLTAASNGTLLIGNTLMDAEFANTPPGTRLELRVSTLTPRPLPPAATAFVVLLLQDEQGGVATCNATIDLTPLGN